MPTALAYRGPNTVRLAKRFFWKECRRLSVLVEGVFFMTLALMTLVWWFTPNNVELSKTMYVIAVGGGAMLAVAAAVTLFSVEKEEGTAELLERLPRNVKAMTLGKLAAAIELVALNTLMYLLFAGVFSNATTSMWEVITFNLPQASLLVLEAFVWSLVASLTCANPLVAAVLGIALASVSIQVGMTATNPSVHGFSPAGLDAAAPARLALAGVGILVAGWLVSRWPAPLRRRRAAVASDLDAPSHKRRWLPSLRLGLFGRLFWQSLRQSWATGFVATLIGLFLTFMCALILGGGFVVHNGWQAVSGFGALFAPAMLGAVVFRADQLRDAYRFLAEHAGRPRMLWLARNAAGLAMLGALLAVLLPVAYWLGSFVSMDNAVRWSYDTPASVEVLRLMEQFDILRHLLIVAAAAAIAAYAYGQFFSLVLRSDVIAAMMALIASITLSIWAGIVMAWRLPPLPFLLPLAIGALLATLLRSRDWMFDRRGLWRWLAPIAMLAAPLAWLYWATPVTRLAQVNVPLASTRTGDRSYTRFEELVNQAEEELLRGQEVAEAYDRLEAKAVTYEEMDRGAVGNYETVLAIVEQAEPDRVTKVTVTEGAGGVFAGEALAEFSRLSRTRCRLPQRPVLFRLLQSAALIDVKDADEPFLLDRRLEFLLACRRIASQGANFSLLPSDRYHAFMFEEFVDWATEEGQTSARIIKAIHGLREAEYMMIGPVGLLMNQHYQAKAILTGRDVPQFRQDKEHQLQPGDWINLAANESIPSEGRRALKALDVLASYDAAYLAEGMRNLSSRSPDLDWLQNYYVDDVLLVTRLSPTSSYLAQDYVRELRVVTNARTSHILSSLFDNRARLAETLRKWMHGVAMYRAERVRMALIAYRIDHDEYPESLAALAPAYLQEYELQDPYTNRLFGWRRQGFDVRAVDVYGSSSAVRVGPISAHTPLLWCSGIAVAQPVERIAGREKGNYFRVLGYTGMSIEEVREVVEEEVSLEKIVYLQHDEQVVHWNSHFWLPLSK